MPTSLSYIHSNLKTGEYSDLTLNSTTKSYTAHRLVVCSQSSVIARGIRHQDSSRVNQQNTQGYFFDFLDDDPWQAVDCLVQWLYYLDYETHVWGTTQQKETADIHQEGQYSPGAIDVTASELVLHVDVYMLAEKYDIPLLKTLALNKFETTVQEHWESDHLLVATRIAYESEIENHREMQNAILNTYIAHSQVLLDKENVRGLLKELPYLCYDLVMHPHKQSKGNMFGSTFTFSYTRP